MQQAENATTLRQERQSWALVRSLGVTCGSGTRLGHKGWSSVPERGGAAASLGDLSPVLSNETLEMRVWLSPEMEQPQHCNLLGGLWLSKVLAHELFPSVGKKKEGKTGTFILMLVIKQFNFRQHCLK